MKLNKMLKSLDSYPFHMPGHKRNAKFNIPSSEIDITEIDGFDNLHSPDGVIKELEEELAKLYNTEKSIISVNGSSCCILSAICAVCDYGDTILIARNCHKSVYNACFIKKLNVEYIEPEYIEEIGTYGKITQEAVDKALNRFENARAVVITSPTYEGVTSEIKADVPVIIDSAHGAHFGFHRDFPVLPYGDIVINSLHKTLPALTQTAVIHINNPKYFEKVKMYMDIFETSSPSYVLMSSIDTCIEFLRNCENDFDAFSKRLDKFYSQVNELENIKAFESDDKSRLVIYADNMSGTSLYSYLQENGIEAEGATLNYVILISSVCDSDDGFELLIKALKKADKVKSHFERFSTSYTLPKKKYNVYEVNSFEKTELLKTEGKVSAQYIYAYPPGVPIIVPGEVISREIIDRITSMKENGVNIISQVQDINIILTKK